MPDLSMSVLVTRTALGLADLEINDHLNYAIGTQFFGATVTWNRSQASSPFLDGQITTQRMRQNVTEQLAVECYADTAAHLQTTMAALLTAFNQDSFTLTITLEGTVYAYACEAADVTVAWTGPRMMAHQGQLLFSVPRRPLALTGGV